MMLRFEKTPLLVLLIHIAGTAKGFQATPIRRRAATQHQPLSVQQRQSFTTLYSSSPQDNKKNLDLDRPPISSSKSSDDGKSNIAATNTINERLMAELQQAADKEKGPRFGGYGEKLGLTGEGNQKTEEERKRSIDEARNLNGINPAVALTGGVVTLIMASVLWFGTGEIGKYFALNPMDSDIYFIQRLTSVFRNVIMGIASLASGFCGVTGLGIFGLGVRVAYGVTVGELDPTPIKRPKRDIEFQLPNAWDLMTKPGRRRNKNEDNSLF